MCWGKPQIPSAGWGQLAPEKPLRKTSISVADVNSSGGDMSTNKGEQENLGVCVCECVCVCVCVCVHLDTLAVYK